MKMYSSLSERLKSQHQAIESILATIHASRSFLRPMPDKWNIHENIAHLTRYQPVFIDRLNQILSVEEPIFPGYIAEEDPDFETYKTLDMDSLINRLHADRITIYDKVAALSEAELNRLGIHKKFGPLNIIQWSEFFLLHEAHHIFTIFRLAYDTELS